MRPRRSIETSLPSAAEGVPRDSSLADSTDALLPPVSPHANSRCIACGWLTAAASKIHRFVKKRALSPFVRARSSSGSDPVVPTPDSIGRAGDNIWEAAERNELARWSSTRSDSGPGDHCSKHSRSSQDSESCRRRDIACDDSSDQVSSVRRRRRVGNSSNRSSFSDGSEDRSHGGSSRRLGKRTSGGGSGGGSVSRSLRAVSRVLRETPGAVCCGNSARVDSRPPRAMISAFPPEFQRSRSARVVSMPSLHRRLQST
ncbi:hypothetical protein CLOM_g24481 [Closterium sp. NIES-68]|nr:hypothetical protein CLOM_g24481 [Closterium sp. NIES-68]GJP85078.1 hypothetical protein CLOP_g15179 [Closterium sp. NIES-67]